MSELNEPKATYSIDRELDLYLAALENHVGEWIAIFNGTLIHSKSPDDISAQLPPGAFSRGEASVTFIAPRDGRISARY